MMTPEQYDLFINHKNNGERKRKLQAILACVEKHFNGDLGQLAFPIRIKLIDYYPNYESLDKVDLTYKDPILLKDAVTFINSLLKQYGWKCEVRGYDIARWYRDGYIIIDYPSCQHFY